jgi:hypothetical protein
MRILSSNAGSELQLELVRETSQQLTFQRGELSQSAAIDRALRNAVPKLFGLGSFCLIILLLMSRAGVFNSIGSNPSGVNLFLLLWVMGMCGIPLAIAFYLMLRPCFISWTFDRIERTLRREDVNLFKQKRVKIYRFDEISKIGVAQVEDTDSRASKCCELYLTLTSGREFTISQGYFTRDRRDRAIALQAHRELAELMRNFLGHVTPDAERADRVFVPSERDRAAESANNLEMLKSVGGALFSSKAKRQSDIENLQERLITERENPQLWENLSLLLAMSRESYRESIEALSQAEALYRERGDTELADDLARKISLFQAKI